jgi:hypothetical protein
MAKKEEKKKPSSKMKGKMSALKGLHKMASDMMADDMKGLKKVSVMAKDKKGLKKGLEKAEDMLGEDDSSEC